MNIEIFIKLFAKTSLNTYCYKYILLSDKRNNTACAYASANAFLY